jgi:membrane-associated HD superfamily phosphohydrolase
MALGLLLVKLAVTGVTAASKLYGSTNEEVKASRYTFNSGFMFTIFYLKFSILAFTVFLFATVWLVFFNDLPAAYVLSTHSKQIKEADFLEDNVRLILVFIGLFCGLITMVLYVSMQLMKKIMRRIERVNTLIQIQSTTLAFFAIALFVILNFTINFDNANASPLLQDQMPIKYKEKYFLVSCVLLALAVSSFIASYFEV